MKSTFEIYSASAGSGKTYALAKSYIKLLINSKNQEHFKNILAITFTNKAVSEMKTRIIDMLRSFSAENYEKTQHSMSIDICAELGISQRELHKKSKIVLNRIIHNYGAFDISTIDGFTHRVIRTFAFDLKLPINFEVELDQDYLLSKAVDGLISKAGTDKALTKILIDFAIEKADDDKSWDISYDFNKIGKLLLSENDIRFVNQLKNKTLEDFKDFKKQLNIKINALDHQITNEAKNVLQLIDEAGLQFDDFNRKSLPNHFLNLKNKKFNLSFDSNWQTDLVEGSPLYPGRVSNSVAETIDNIQPLLIESYNRTKAWLFDLKFNKAIYKNITPLSVLNALQKELKTLKDDENKLLISEFNALVSNEIKNQPTPFIYERLGEKFKHYFIDEFQDTSLMQWQNLIPLMDNALSSNRGSAMLVGDAKQSIYRWRGGDAEQFIDLFQKKSNPFQLEVDVKNLESNFRSHKAIVNFNNSFFTFISEHFFTNENYASLYEKSYQNAIKEKEGYVKLSFLEFDDSETRNEVYVHETFKTIQSCIDNGYLYKDICVLVRKRKEGIAISDYLTTQGINIVSSETLLLNNSPKVKLLNLAMWLLVNPEDETLKLELLFKISELFDIKNKHDFFVSRINLSLENLFNSFKSFDVLLDLTKLLQMPIYEMAETLVRNFKLCEDAPDAYVQFFLDTIFEFSKKQASDILGFLDYFETKKENLSIAMPNNLNAVSVMTIHKSKGLEFPVVIFPFADLDMYRELEPKEWFPLKKESYSGFESALIDYSKDFQNFGQIGEQIYSNHQSEIELDSINLLYVTLTRAIEQLYIFSKKDINNKGLVNEKTYAGLFINFLKNNTIWDETKTEYSFGSYLKPQGRGLNYDQQNKYQFISSSKESHNLKIMTNSGALWDTKQEKAMAHGNLVHLVMSQIKSLYDVDMALKVVASNNPIEEEQLSSLKEIVISIVSHKTLSDYFSGDYDVYNEKDIVTTDGYFLRPDRLVIKNKNAVIIDYKTGAESTSYNTQIESYAKVLEEMDFIVSKKLLVYTNNPIKIYEVK